MGEFLILLGTFRVSPLYAVLGTAGIILAAVYMLWMFQRVMFGPVVHEANRSLPDLSARELATLVPILALIVWIGVYPQPFLRTTEASVKQLLAQVHVRYRASAERRDEQAASRGWSAGRRAPGAETSESRGAVPASPLTPHPVRVVAVAPPTATSGAGPWALASARSRGGRCSPVLLVTGTGLLVLVLDSLLSAEGQQRLPVVGLVGLGLTGLVLLAGPPETATTFGGMLAADGFARFCDGLFLLVAALTLLISIAYLPRAGMDAGEYTALILFSTLGMMVMAGSLDLMTIFLGLETLSISLYILAGFQRERLPSNESALKYLLLGAFASGFVLYGIALIYGATGSINLKRVAAALGQGQAASPVLLVIGMGLLIVGFGFKVAAVPFHMWAPDVYEGAPTSVTAFMIAGTKAAAFAALARILMTALPALQPDWSRVLWALAALTMTVGNVVAVAQTSIKRMLAYSSIAHAGYLLVALVTGTKLGSGSILFYLAAYACMNLGAFAVIVALSRPGAERVAIAEYAGLGLRRPLLGGGHGPVHALAGRRAPHGGFHGEALRLRCRDPGGVHRAGRPGRAEQRRLGLLLPARHRGDVHVADRGTAGGRARGAGPRPLALLRGRLGDAPPRTLPVGAPRRGAGVGRGPAGVSRPADRRRGRSR